jgi:hypothetical protein
VVDSLNGRVLRFDSAASKANDSGADGVLGQADFTGRVVAPTQLGLYGSQGVAVGSAGRLWVADTANHWVLLFQENMMVQQIAEAGASPTNTSNLELLVSIDGPVSGLSASNFSITPNGTINGAGVTIASGPNRDRGNVVIFKEIFPL